MQTIKKKIAYIPSEIFSKNAGYDQRNIIYFAKITKTTIYKFNKKKKYDYLVLPPNFDVSDINWLNSRKEKIIFQLVDNYLSEKKFGFKSLFRGIYKYLINENKNLIFNYKKNLLKLCKLSHAVICSSKIQKKIIGEYNKNVKVFFESHFELITEIKKKNTIGKKIKIAWEGRCENLESLSLFVKPFQKLIEKFQNIELHIFSDFESYNTFFPLYKKNSIKILKKLFGNLFSTNTTFYNSYVYFHQWNKVFTPQTICRCDIAIIPLDTKDGFHYGKSYNKLIMFHKYKIPTVTSKIPSYTELEKKIRINFTCKSQNEWIRKITKILNNKNYRSQLVNKSFFYVQKKYSVNRFISQWKELFN